MKTCTKCGETKEKTEFHKTGKYLSSECKPCRCELQRKSDAKHSERRANRKLEQRYGITIEDYERMLVEQNHQCYICNAETKLVVDHCHESGKVRGLLCHQCNIMLGMAKDNPAILRLAANYLEQAK